MSTNDEVVVNAVIAVGERERTRRHIRRDTNLVKSRRIAFECAKHLDRVDLRIMRHLEPVGCRSTKTHCQHRPKA